MDLTRDQVLELLAAHALDAVDGEEWAAIEDALARDRSLAAAADHLREVAGWLGATEATPPPVGTRERLLERAFARRPPRLPTVEPAHPVDAFVAQVDELAVLLDDLHDEEWQLLTVTGWHVQGLVAHLVAVERYTGSLLGVGDYRPPAGLEGDHRGMTEPEVEAHRGHAPSETVAAWRDAAGAVVAAVRRLEGADLERQVSFHGLELALGSLLTARVFELWTHADDIRAATGRPSRPPDPHRLALMTALAVRSLPLGLLLVGLDRSGRTARIVLTGEGGGTWVQPLGHGETASEDVAAAADVVLVTDAVEFCRLFAQRRVPDELDVDVTGDEALAADILVGAQVFAA